MLVIVVFTALSYYKNHTFPRPNCSYARHVQEKCVDPRTVPTPSSLSVASRATTLLVVKTPNLQSGEGHMRIRVLLDVLEYRCYVSPQWPAFKMIALVGSGEKKGCERVCEEACECVEARHMPFFHHLDLARLVNGVDNLLFVHADMFIDLLAWHELTTRFPERIIMPFNGLPKVRSGCFGVDALESAEAKRWFWWMMDSKAK